MRLLLILALLLSAIAMARPAPVEAAAVMADCHGMMADHGAPDDTPADNTGDNPARNTVLVHTCPGCAAVEPPVMLFGPLVMPLVPRLIKASTWRPSVQSAPVPPPPQIT